MDGGGGDAAENGRSEGEYVEHSLQRRKRRCLHRADSRECRCKDSKTSPLSTSLQLLLLPADMGQGRVLKLAVTGIRKRSNVETVQSRPNTFSPQSYA